MYIELGYSIWYQSPNMAKQECSFVQLLRTIMYLAIKIQTAQNGGNTLAPFLSPSVRTPNNRFKR
jgi:hypothetical protein